MFPQRLAHCGCLFEPGKVWEQSEVRAQGNFVMLPLPSLCIHLSGRSVIQHTFSVPLLGASSAMEAGQGCSNEQYLPSMGSLSLGREDRGPGAVEVV